MGSRGLSVPHAEVFPVCVVVTQEAGVLIPSIKHHLFHFKGRLQRLILPEEEARKRRKRKERGVWNGSFSGKVIFSVDFSVLPEMPFFGLADLV